MSAARDFDREAGEFGGRRYDYEFDRTVRSYMMRAFKPYLPQGRALELGCHRGESTEQWAELYQDLTVIEAAPTLVAAAQARLGARVRFICGRFEQTALADTFDAIFLINTLEHIDEPVSLLARARQWLAPQGRLFVLVPNAHAASRQIAVHMGLITHNAAVTREEQANGHRTTFSFDTLGRAMSEAGLRTIHRGGLIFKALANRQLDAAMDAGIISDQYIEGCYQLGLQYPDLCASLFTICEA